MTSKVHKETLHLSLSELSLSREFCDLLTLQVFPHLLQNSSTPEIRIWLTGCDSGMEVYVVALCWSQFIAASETKPNLRIFSSDLKSDKIFHARLGKFERVHLKQLPKETIDRFFIKEGTNYTINKEIRQWCIFAEHNTIGNPPFQNIDLIICMHVVHRKEDENQLILFHRLHHSVRETGLVIFTSVDQVLIPSELFKPWMNEHFVYTKAISSQKSRRLDGRGTGTDGTKALLPPADESIFDAHAKRELLKHAPPGFVVNSEMEIVRFYGSTSLFFQPSNGSASYQFTKLLRHEISVVVFRLIQRVKKSNFRAKAEQVQVESIKYEIDVSPFKSEGDDYYMVVVRKADPVKNNKIKLTVRHNASNNSVLSLQNKLCESQEDMFALKEEYESTNEDLRTAYEEIISANEELQSINRELESSKSQLEEANKTLLKTQHSLIHVQQKLQLALRAGSAATWSMDIASGKVNWSPDHENIYGIKNGHFRGDVTAWLELIHPEDLEKVKAALLACKKKHDHFDEEFRIIHPDQTVRWVMCKGEITIHESDKKNMIGISIDVTERNEAYAKLIESEHRFEFVSNHAPVMIWMADQNQKVIFTNETVSIFTGQYSEQELATSWLELVHHSDKDKTRKIFLEAFEKKEPFETEFRFRRKDGKYRWVMNHAIPRFAQGNQFIGFIGICLDINDRVESQNQKDDFIAIASHELKTPVTSLKSYAEILHMQLMHLGNQNLAAMFLRLNNQIDKLSQLMNKLLDVTKIENGNLEFYKEKIELNQLVEGVCEEMQQNISSHTIELTQEATGWVWADRDRIGQVVSNLIQNAIKYSPEGNKITVNTREKASELMVSVQDQGPGISLRDQEKIFKRFYRSRDEQNAHIAGLGLGLFIAHEIITKHQGRIWVTSIPGQGATFTFTLPRL